MRMLLVATPLLLVAACTDDAPTNKSVAEVKQLAAGAYEVQAKVESFAKTDTGAPQRSFKVGDVTTLKGCVGNDGTPAPALFTEPGDVCRTTQSYASGGMLNVQLNCDRKGKAGSVNYSIDGQFKSDSFTAKVTTGTSFSSPDDYTDVRALTAKRVGNCQATETPVKA